VADRTVRPTVAMLFAQAAHRRLTEVIFSERENAVITFTRRGRPVRAMNMSTAAALLAAAAIGSLGTAAAQPDVNDPAINGVFAATSNGEWATSNMTYHDEQTVRSTWTIASSCVNPVQCAGTVKSDEGWTANIVHVAGMWKVIRDLPGWETCGDGTAATGRQVYTFYPMTQDPAVPVQATSTTFSGYSSTIGPSGACGISWPLNIEVPFKLVKIS
jgi:hypothetical protein